MSQSLRLAYRAILRLHPIDFRAEFGNEMLWIFDEEARSGHALPLFFDGLRSILVQNIRPYFQQPEPAGPIYIEIDSSLPSERIAQTWLVIICGILCIGLFLSMVAPRVVLPISDLFFTSSHQQHHHLHHADR
ncbi:MAG: hypothetical protein PW789_04660 [Edaphobacter sp.]|uniref:hypothetical protein n=1 Tax=Edaphobacter sp. TaxID=1934404 RepID=UPI002383FA5C|nr:hypothetical protein [Edaphobacter sp.]MDE1175878.1 hypothetical protein [Edaphobacter sp.]